MKFIFLSLCSLALITKVLCQNEVFAAQCTRHDVDCLTQAAQDIVPRFTAGIPELGVDPVDPFVLKDYTIDLAGLTFATNGAAKGYKNAKLDRVAFDFDKNMFSMNFHVNMTMKGRYKASGQLLFLPIQGEGDIKIKTVDCVLNVTAPFDITTGADSKSHIQLGNFDLKFDIMGNVHYTLTNLFNGNKDLSDAMHNLINTNWRLVSNEFASPVIRTGIEQVFENINKAFQRLSVEKMFLD